MRQDARGSVSKSSVSNFVHALIAVVVGNILYFVSVPYLPPAAHHMPRRMDLGMVVDFWFCLMVLGVVKTVVRLRQASNPQ